MRKFTFVLMLLAMVAGASWGQVVTETATIEVSTNVENPEHVYYMMNGNGRWMTVTTGPTVTHANAAQFAFFEGTRTGSGTETPYKIYCVTAKKWLTYTKAGSYVDGTINFASLTDNKDDAESWVPTLIPGGKAGNNGEVNTKVYQFAPYNNTGVASKYLNWFEGPNSNPNDNTDITVGLYKDNASNDAGSCWKIVTPDNIRAVYYAEWKTANLGSEFNQYHVDEAELSNAEAVLNDAMDLASVMDALNACKALYTLNMADKYFRIQSTSHKTYLGIDGYTLNMKNKVLADTDPTLIWKCEKDGDKYYLKNVYAGLYPQYVVSGASSTTQIGTSKNYAFTLAKHADAADGNPIVWNIFFGARQVNIETNGNVNQWTADNAHHYIHEVNYSSEELDKMCTDWYKVDGNAYTPTDVDLPTPIGITPDAAVIISPNEFAAPQTVNAAIAALELLNLPATGVTMEKIHKLYNGLVAAPGNRTIVNQYKNALSNGNLLSIDYEAPNAEYATIILNVNWRLPAGWHRYACAGATGNVLTLEDKDGEGTNKNTPYIVRLDEDKRGLKYQFIGYDKEAATDNRTSGWLTGVLVKNSDTSKVPAGSYILSTYNGKQGFFKIAEGTSYAARQYRCYLTVPAGARYTALFFDGDFETGIDNVADAENEQGNGLIYNMAGQRLNGLQKGLNIVNGKIVLK